MRREGYLDIPSFSEIENFIFIEDAIYDIHAGDIIKSASCKRPGNNAHVIADGPIFVPCIIYPKVIHLLMN